MTSERLRKQRSLAGKIGAYKRWSRADPVVEIRPAQEAYAASFRTAHGGDPAEDAGFPKRLRRVGLCSICPTRIEIPDSWTDEQRDEMAQNLRTLHFQRLSAKAVAARREAG